MQKDQPAESTAPMYWLKDGEFPSGPFTQQQLKSRLAAAEIPASSYVCPVNGKEWLKLSELLDLAPRAEETSDAMPGNASDRFTVNDVRPPSTTPSAIASTAPVANSLGAWLSYIAKLAGLALVGYLLFIRPWRSAVKPPPRPTVSVQIEEERAQRAEYQGQFDEASAHRRRAAEERAYEERKLRKKQ